MKHEYTQQEMKAIEDTLRALEGCSLVTDGYHRKLIRNPKGRVIGYVWQRAKEETYDEFVLRTAPKWYQKILPWLK